MKPKSTSPPCDQIDARHSPVAQTRIDSFVLVSRANHLVVQLHVNVFLLVPFDAFAFGCKTPKKSLNGERRKKKLSADVTLTDDRHRGGAENVRAGVAVLLGDLPPPRDVSALADRVDGE